MPAITDPLDDDDLNALEQLLDQLAPPEPPAARRGGKAAAAAQAPDPLEPLDLMMLDGYLCGVLLQPKPVPLAQWFRHVPDVDGRPPPAGYPLADLQALVERRHAELDRAISQRQWFDPWVFELDDAAEPLETVMPWVAGFATAMELFPALMRIDSTESLEPLAVLYAAFDPEDLEDADALLEAIESLEPPAELADAVEGLVNSTLLLADVSRPQPLARRPAGNTRRPRPGGAGPRGGGGTGGGSLGGSGRGGGRGGSGRPGGARGAGGSRGSGGSRGGPPAR